MKKNLIVLCVLFLCTSTTPQLFGKSVEKPISPNFLNRKNQSMLGLDTQTIPIPCSLPYRKNALSLIDFDGDCKTDYSVWRQFPGQTTSQFLIFQSSSNNMALYNFGQPNDQILNGDFDGDYKTDFTIFRKQSAGDNWWYIMRSSDFTVFTYRFGGDYDEIPDTPVPADYDGDGKTDIAIFRDEIVGGNIHRPTYYFRSSLKNDTRVFILPDEADGNFLPVYDYFDNDGVADIGIYKILDGNWKIKMSTTGEISTVDWGMQDDIPVPADYDGDNIVDRAVWRRSEQKWYILKSTGGNLIYTFGLQTDLPAVGDYDGNGTMDVAVLRVSEWKWYVLGNNMNFTSFVWGMEGDKPIIFNKQFTVDYTVIGPPPPCPISGCVSKKCPPNC